MDRRRSCHPRAAEEPAQGEAPADHRDLGVGQGRCRAAAPRTRERDKTGLVTMALPPPGPPQGSPDLMSSVSPMALGASPPGMDPVLEPPVTPAGENVVSRETPEPPERRKALVDALTDMVKNAKSYWDKP